MRPLCRCVSGRQRCIAGNQRLIVGSRRVMDQTGRLRRFLATSEQTPEHLGVQRLRAQRGEGAFDCQACQFVPKGHCCLPYCQHATAQAFLQCRWNCLQGLLQQPTLRSDGNHRSEFEEGPRCW